MRASLVVVFESIKQNICVSGILILYVLLYIYKSFINLEGTPNFKITGRVGDHHVGCLMEVETFLEIEKMRKRML